MSYLQTPGMPVNWKKKALEEERKRLALEAVTHEREAGLSENLDYASDYDVSPGPMRRAAERIRKRIAEIDEEIKHP